MKKSLKVLSVIFAFMMIISSLPISASAKTLEEIEAEIEQQEKELEKLANQKDQQETYIEELQKQIKSYDEQLSIISSEMDSLNLSISKLDADIKEYEVKIAALDAEIKQVDEQIAVQNEKIDETYEVLKKRLRAAYMAGETSELEIFLSAEDFQDFLTRSELVRQVSKHDSAVVGELKEQIKSLNTMVEELNQKRAEQVESKQKLDADRAELATKRQEVVAKRNDFDSKKAAVEAKLNKANELISKLDQNSKLVQDLLAKAEKEKADFAAQLDKDIGNNGSSGDGSVNNGEVSHNFRVSSKGLISPLQDKTTYYSATYAQHCSRGTASVDLCAPANRVFNGQTYYTSKGAKVYAVASGTVTKSTYVAGTYGHYINIDHGNGLSSLVCHLDARYVNVGDKVIQGQVIGLVGNTGNCWPRPSASNPVAGSHLHFEMRLNGNRVNPELYLPSPLV
ncbi:MAG: murein hydrolase activator EnvC family protein [Candidatus Fimenecus sp.]